MNRSMKRLPSLLALLALVLAACGPGGGFRDVSVRDLAAATEPGRIVLDVREPWEFQEGHVPDAILIPLADLEGRYAELPEDAPIYVICRSGNRSRQASEILAENGRKDVRNVEGGILAWQAAGLPVVR